MLRGRRAAGAGVLVVALLGLLVVAGLQGVRVAGTAMAPPGSERTCGGRLPDATA